MYSVVLELCTQKILINSIKTQNLNKNSQEVKTGGQEMVQRVRCLPGMLLAQV